NLDLRALVQALRGAWIGPLRWYGLSEFAEGMRLAWTLEDDSIRLETFIRPGQLVVTAKVASPDRLDDATRLGHQLFQHIVREVSRESYSGMSGSSRNQCDERYPEPLRLANFVLQRTARVVDIRFRWK